MRRTVAGVALVVLSLAGAYMAPAAPPRRVCIPTPWIVCDVPKLGGPL